VTVGTTEYQPGLPKPIGDMREAYASEKEIKLHPKQDLRGLYGTGQTLYIGSRESPRFGRIYDKQAQDEDPACERCVRFEIEYKKVCAPLVAAWLLQEQNLGIAAAQSVVGQLAEWGIELDLGLEGRLVAGSVGRRNFDSDRVLKWLREQVAPSIEKLLQAVDTETIEEALGLCRVPESTLPLISRKWVQETGQALADVKK